jgi:hypothetical protein
MELLVKQGMQGPGMMAQPKHGMVLLVVLMMLEQQRAQIGWPCSPRALPELKKMAK